MNLLYFLILILFDLGFLPYTLGLSINYKDLLNEFHLKKSDCLKEKFETNSLELIYPETFKNIKRCIIVANSKNLFVIKKLALKFELQSQIRQWWNKNTNDIDKSTDSSDKYNNKTIFQPMELHVMDVVQRMDFNTRKLFIPYYKDSMCVLETTDKDRVYVYAMERLNNAINLLDWYEENKNRMDLGYMEAKLKTYFKTIYKALIALVDNGLVYTDLKPQNILIDIDNDRAYFTDLESVEILRVSISAHELKTPSFFPPDKGEISPHRVLKYTFGMSIYSLLCDENLKVKGNTTRISCAQRISNELFTLINYCLFKKDGRFSEVGLKPWLVEPDEN
jgi:serine/threonine protein kinase